MNKNWLFGTVILSMVTLIGCGVDDELDVNGGLGTPTPLELDLPAFFGAPYENVDNPLTVEGVELGRMLFYEKMLSGDNTVSCGSCHQQEHAFTDGLGKAVGIDDLEGTRSSMSVVNAAWDHHFFWDGRSATLEEQALLPIENPIEMNETLPNVLAKLQASSVYPAKFEAAFETTQITSELVAKALAQFERTLISSNSRYDQFLRGEIQFTEQELRGFNLFSTHPVPGQVRGGNCGDCHLGYTQINKDLKNNGIDGIIGSDIGFEAISGDTIDRGKFKVVSLRNIALTAPYMHDGRFATLDEVMDHYNDTTITVHENVDPEIIGGVNEPMGTSLLLTEQEKQDIIVFMQTLTDTSFINNDGFSDPF